MNHSYDNLIKELNKTVISCPSCARDNFEIEKNKHISLLGDTGDIYTCKRCGYKFEISWSIDTFCKEHLS